MKEAMKRCIIPGGSYGGQPVGPDDVMGLRRGGTGFAGHDKELQVGRLGDVGGWRAGGGQLELARVCGVALS